MHQTWALGLSHYLALADNFSFHLVMEKGTNIQVVFALGQYYQLWLITFLSPFHGQGPQQSRFTHLWSAHTLLGGHVIILSYCILSMLFTNKGCQGLFPLGGCDNHQFFLKRFLWVGISCEVPQEALFSLGTRVESPSPL